MIRGRAGDEIERYDIFKVIVLVILSFIMLFRWGGITIDSAQTSGQPDIEATTSTTVVSQPDTGAATSTTVASQPDTEATTSTTVASQPDSASTDEIMPVLNRPAEPLAPGEVELSGTGTPGSTVEVIIDGQSAGSAVVSDAGRWSLPANFAQPGDYEIGLRTLDANGAVLATAEPVVVTVAAAEPVPFEVAAPTLNLVDGEARPAGEIVLSGTGQPEFPLQILFNGQVDGTTLVGSDGQWRYTTRLTEPGDYQVQVLSLDPDGQILAALVPSTLTIIAAEPEPTATSASTDTEITTITAPTLDLPEIEARAGEITLNGTGQPGTEVQIVVDGEVIGTATVDETGQWTFAAQIEEPGPHEVTIRLVDETGVELAVSQPATLTVTPGAEVTPEVVEVTAPTLDLSGVENATAGEITLNGTGQPGSEVEILLDGTIVGIAPVAEDGTWRFVAEIEEPGDHQVSVQITDDQGQVLAVSEPARLTIIPVRPEVAAPVLDLPSGELRVGEAVSLSGTGEPDSEIEILIDGAAVGTATADGGGVWTFETEFDEAGAYEVLIRAVDADGNVLAESEAAVLTVAAAAVEVVMPTLELPDEVAMAGRSIVFRGIGGPRARIELLIDSELAGTGSVNLTGRWLIMTKIATPGEHEISVQVVDPAGAVLATSEPATLTVVEPEVVTPTLNLPQTIAATGSTITLRGTGTPGTTVEIFVDGQAFGTATVGDDGNWRFEVELDQPGDYEIEVRVIDAAGQVLAVSEPATVTVEPEIEPTPEITVPEPEPDQEDGEVYIVQQDDWLSKLSDKFYGDMFAYDIIVEATNAKAATDSSFAIIEDPDLIEIGQKLWIPNLSNIEVN